MLALELASSSVRSVRVDTLYAISITLCANTPTPPRWHRARTDFWAQRGGTPFVRKAIAHERVIWTEKGATKEPSERGASNPSAQRRCPRSRQLRGPETIKVQSVAPSYVYIPRRDLLLPVAPSLYFPFVFCAPLHALVVLSPVAALPRARVDASACSFGEWQWLHPFGHCRAAGRRGAAQMHLRAFIRFRGGCAPAISCASGIRRL